MSIRRIKIYFTFFVLIVSAALFVGATSWSDKFNVFTNNIRTAGVRAEYENYIRENQIFNPFYLFRVLAGNYEMNFSREKSAESITVLVYHGITEKDDGSNINSTISEFKDHMFALKKAGYTTIDLPQLYKFMRGEDDLPRRSILITFDDGRADSYVNGDPILRALDFKAVMFVISSYSVDKDSTYYLSKEQLVEMEKTGRWDIQAHTHDGHNSLPIDPNHNNDHFFSHRLWLAEENRLETEEEFRKRIVEDMEIVKSKLSETLGKDIIGFAFPFGDFGQRYGNGFPANIVLDETSKRYKLMFYQDSPIAKLQANYPGLEPQESYLIRRTDIHDVVDGEGLIEALEKVESKAIPYSDDFGSDNGWISTWGNFYIRPGEMTLEPKQDGAGAAVVLDGTGAWRDYSVKATLESPNRNSAYVWVRYVNDDNNASCNIGRGFAHIEYVVNGEHSVIRGVRSEDIILPSGNFEMEVRVQGRTVQCFINGRLMVETTFLDQSLKRGGIGFKVWDGTDGSNAILRIKNIRVSAL